MVASWGDNYSHRLGAGLRRLSQQHIITKPPPFRTRRVLENEFSRVFSIRGVSQAARDTVVAWGLSTGLPHLTPQKLCSLSRVLPEMHMAFILSQQINKGFPTTTQSKLSRSYPGCRLTHSHGHMVFLQAASS